MIAPIDNVTLTFDTYCRCGQPLRVPLKRDWSSPLYVMAMEREHKIIQEQMTELHSELLELAAECVAAGVRPAILKRADEMKATFEELKRRYGI